MTGPSWTFWRESDANKLGDYKMLSDRLRDKLTSLLEPDLAEELIMLLEAHNVVLKAIVERDGDTIDLCHRVRENVLPDEPDPIDRISRG